MAEPRAERHLEDQYERLHDAVDALESVRDLFVQCSRPRPHGCLDQVDADRLAALMTILIAELRAVQDGIRDGLGFA